MPVRPYARATRIASHCVAPSAYAASRCWRGTCFSTSRASDEMNGVIITARISAADNIPSPSGGPVNNGNCRNDWGMATSSARTSGTSTNTPHRPYTIDGMAARSSVRKISGCRSIGGQSSDRYVATPSETGAAIRRASSDEYSVPQMNGRAPNSPETGSQVSVTQNLNPNS